MEQGGGGGRGDSTKRRSNGESLDSTDGFSTKSKRARSDGRGGNDEEEPTGGATTTNNGKTNTTGPFISNGVVDFPISTIHDRLVCGLCSGYFKDPYTITECLHTFCKSCLFYAVACGCHECPECKVYLGNDPLRVAVLDHALQELVDRIIFPDIVKQEEAQEREFYESRGIPLKPEYALKAKKMRAAAAAAASSSNRSSISPPKKDRSTETNKATDALEFTLMPEVTSTATIGLPPLERPCLRISAKFRMNQLKKYLFQKLDLGSDGQPALDILCNGVPLGDEISLSFVKRLLWPYESDLALTYRVAEDVG